VNWASFFCTTFQFLFIFWARGWAGPTFRHCTCTSRKRGRISSDFEAKLFKNIGKIIIMHRAWKTLLFFFSHQYFLSAVKLAAGPICEAILWLPRTNVLLKTSEPLPFPLVGKIYRENYMECTGKGKVQCCSHDEQLLYCCTVLEWRECNAAAMTGNTCTTVRNVEDCKLGVNCWRRNGQHLHYQTVPE
jgi:hypothetical protein